MQACDHHLKAVREWGKIEDVGGMRRFLGNFKWVRQHFPVEYILCLPALTQQVKKNATWPMPAKAERAQKALQKLAEQAMQLYPLDVCAAITRERARDLVNRREDPSMLLAACVPADERGRIAIAWLDKGGSVFE